MWPSRGFFFCPPFLITSRSPRKHSGKRRRADRSSPDVATATGQYFYKCLPTTPSALHAIVAVVTQLGIGRHEGK